jgi:fructose-1,6-bisphosphatase II
MFDPGPCVYMEKISGGHDIADLFDLDRPLDETLGLVAERRGKDIRDVMVVMLDRPRNEDAMTAVRNTGARLRLISHGDVSASLLAVSDNSPVDVMFGIGGTPEGVISAAATKCLGGGFVGRLWPRDDEERDAAVAAGYDLDHVLTIDDLVNSDDVFFAATGVTDGDFLRGVRYWPDGAGTQSLVMRSKSGTIRTIDAMHRWSKLMRYSAVRYET